MLVINFNMIECLKEIKTLKYPNLRSFLMPKMLDLHIHKYGSPPVEDQCISLKLGYIPIVYQISDVTLKSIKTAL